MQSKCLCISKRFRQFHLAVTLPPSSLLRMKISSYTRDLSYGTLIHNVDMLKRYAWNVQNLTYPCFAETCTAKNFILAAGLRLDYIPEEKNIWPSCFLWISNHTWMSSRASPSITGFHSLGALFHSDNNTAVKNCGFLIRFNETPALALRGSCLKEP